jgi:hypothetical protein
VASLSMERRPSRSSLAENSRSQVAHFDRHAGRHPLRTGPGTDISDHLEDVNARDLKRRAGKDDAMKSRLPARPSSSQLKATKAAGGTGHHRLQAAAKPSMAATALPLSFTPGHAGTES